MGVKVNFPRSISRRGLHCLSCAVGLSDSLSSTLALVRSSPFAFLRDHHVVIVRCHRQPHFYIVWLSLYVARCTITDVCGSMFCIPLHHAILNTTEGITPAGNEAMAPSVWPERAINCDATRGAAIVPANRCRKCIFSLHFLQCLVMQSRFLHTRSARNTARPGVDHVMVEPHPASSICGDPPRIHTRPGAKRKTNGADAGAWLPCKTASMTPQVYPEIHTFHVARSRCIHISMLRSPRTYKR